MKKILKYSELFCGPGGMGLGAKLASEEHSKDHNNPRIEHLWATDFDKDACETYALNSTAYTFFKSIEFLFRHI